ncbi:MAG: right-handed parallel beta-helix repeat-containing protein [Gemmatimonadota bacterium]
MRARLLSSLFRLCLASVLCLSFDLWSAQQLINVGTSAGDGTGDGLRTASQKANANFTEIYGSYLPRTNGTSTNLTINQLTVSGIGLEKAIVSDAAGRVTNSPVGSATLKKFQQSVTDYTALMALDTTIYTNAYVLADGKQGAFTWWSGDTSPTNSGTCFTSGSGRWKRDDVKAVAVHWFGTDTAAFQSAVTLLTNVTGAGPWTGGKELYLGPYTYTVTSSIDLPPNAIVIGAGRNATRVNAPNGTAFRCLGDPNYTMKVSFRDLAIDGVNVQVAGAGIVLGGTTPAHEIHLENVDVWRCYDGIWVTNFQVGSVLNCKLRNNARDGFHQEGYATAARLASNYSASNGRYGFYVRNMSYSAFIATAADANASAGYKIDATASTSSSNNTFISCGSEGNPIGFDIDTAYELTMIGCYGITSSTYGAKLAGCPGPRLVNCRFEGTAQGLFVTSSAISGLIAYSVSADGGIFNCNNTNLLVAVNNTGFRDASPHVAIGGFPELAYPLSVTGPNQRVLNLRRLAATNFAAHIDSDLALGFGSDTNPALRVASNANTNNPPTAAAAGFGIGYSLAQILAPLVVNGHAGIGTNNPQARLHVSATNAATPQLLIDNPGSSPTLAGLVIYASNSGQGGARNWALVINQGAYGDAQFKRSTANGADPLGGNNVWRYTPNDEFELNSGTNVVLRTDGNGTAGNTRLIIYDVDNGQLERVSVGAAGSAGVGFKVLRIPD